MEQNLKADALLEEIQSLHNRYADLRVQLHVVTLSKQELERRVAELEEDVRSYEESQDLGSDDAPAGDDG